VSAAGGPGGSFPLGTGDPGGGGDLHVPAPKVARKICVRNVIRPCDVGHRGNDLAAATLPTMQLTGVEAVMPRSISQLLIGATVAIGSAVVGVTAIGSATAQSPLEQTKSTTNRYEPAARRSISESVIISSETFSSVVAIV